MKKLSIFVAFLLLGIVGMQAAPVDAAKARKVADRYVRINGLYDKTQKVNRVTDITSQTTFTGFYIFRIEGTPSGRGFVLVSADDCARPILGYSAENDFAVEGMPAHVESWLREYEQQIERGREAGLGTNPQWQRLLDGDREMATHVVVGALVATRWNQSPLYNNLCPWDSAGNGRSVTGCVATAMAQLMKYWNRPVQGTGSHSYSTDSYGTLSANFGSTQYDWSHMPVQLTSSSTATEINAVATLMYHCGVAVEMDYSASGSGATTIGRVASWYTAECALFNYFGYNNSLQGSYMSSYTDAQWKQMLMNDLNAGRPMIYRGSSSSGGHCFICDGYDSDTNFHFNFGWGGSSDGFYTLSATGSNTMNYNGNQGAITGIYPNNMPLMMPAGVQVSGVNTTATTVSWVNPNNAGTTQVQVAYGPAASFNLNNSATYTVVTAASGNSKALSGLSPYTQYNVAVRTVAGSNYSAWTEAVSFTTLANPQTPPTLVDCENGVPTYWTQEQINGSVLWTQASGGYNNNHPTGALSGSYNLRLQANGYGSVTRLISPMLTLTPTDGREYTATTTHKLAYGHAQANWSGDIDYLYVYYRTSPTADWNLLASYTEEIANWQRDTLTLPSPTSTYQVAFEGHLNYGYGVVLDDISFFTETEGSDSIVVADDTIACDSYTVTDNNGTRTITTTGTYRLVYTAVSGIDSIIMRTVMIRHATHNSTTTSAVGRYIWHDSIYTESGTHVYTYTNAYGCPSADTLHLTIEPCVTLYRNQYVDACDEYLWSNGVTYYESTNDAYDTLTVDGGCDLILTLNLTIYHSTHNNFTQTAMNTYTWHDSLYFETGDFPYHYTDVHGCASADTLHLTITPAPAVVVDDAHPFYDDFEGDFSWYLENGATRSRWAYGSAAAYGGTHAMYISDDRGHSNHYVISQRSVVYASKLFTLTAGMHFIGYDWRANGESNYDYIRVFLAPASATFTPNALPNGSTGNTNTYTTDVPAGWIALDGSEKKNLDTTWQSFTAEANVTAAGNYRVVFVWISDNSVGQMPPAAIDNVTIQRTNCGRPTDVVVSNVTPTGATVTWRGTGTQYLVAYGAGSDPAQMATVTTSDTTITLMGLTDNTDYNVYVRNVCSPTLNSAWSGMVSFITPCLPVVVDETHPYNEDFEGARAWWMANGNRINRWHWGTAVNNGGSRAIYISNDGGVSNTYNNAASGVTYATKLFALKGGTYHVAYDWRAYGERSNSGVNYDYMRVFFAPGSTNVVAGTTLPNGGTSTSAFANATPAGWISADSSQCKNMVNSWQHFETDIAFPDSGDYVMLFLWVTDANTGTNPPAAVDNVSITRPFCAEPNNLHVAEVHATTATLAWAGNGDNFQVAWGTGTDVTSMTLVSATGTSHTLTGLSPNTVYHAYVRAVCANNASTAWIGPVEIATPCTPYTVTTTNPFTENFENDLGCWRTIYPCENNAIIITTSVSTTTSYNNSHSLRFSSYYSCSDGYYQYAVTRELSCAAPMQMSFHYRNHNQYNNLWVGYSTTGNNPENFTTWMEVPNNSGTWSTYSCEVPLGTKYVAFRYYGNNSYYSYVDDIELRWARYHITALTSDSTQGTASGSSTRNYNATATLRAFPTACYQFSHWNDGNTDNPRPVTVTRDSTFTAYFTPATLTGSETVAACESYRWGGTTYRSSGTYSRHITTAAGCDSVATLHLTINHSGTGDTTATACESFTWYGTNYTSSTSATRTTTTTAGCDSTVTLNLTVNHGTFNSTTDTSHVIPYSWHDNFYSASGTYTYSYTNADGCASVDTLHLVLAECEAISVMPFTESFEGYTAHAFNLPCWHRFTTTQYPMVAGSGHTGSRGLLWVRTNTPRQYLILPRINTTLYPIDTLQLSMWARGNFYSPVEVGVMTLNGDTSTFTTVGTLNMSMGSNWTERTLPLSPYTGNGQYIALRISGTNSGNLYIDDITVSIAPTCFAPESIAISNITHNSAAVAWNDTAASYVVAYGTGTTPEGMDSVVVSTPSTLLTGLTPNTQYHLFIRSVCSSNNRSEWSGMYTFQTECVSLTMPYIEDFESYNTSSYSSSTFPVTCWHRISNGTTYYSPYVSNSTIVRHAGNRGLYWNMAANAAYGTSQYAILPGLDTSFYPTSRHQLSFWRRANTTSQRPVFIIGVMSDPNDTNTFVPVDTVNITSTAWTKDSVSLESYTGHGNHIAICARANGSWVAGMDDLRVSVIPICFPPTNIATGTVTTNSATLSWTGAAGTYKVAYGLGNDPEVMDSVIVTGNSATLTGLSPATTYNVFFQGICGVERSAWSTSFSFTTACGLVTQLPITQGFEGYPSGNESTPNADFGVPCWTHINNGSVYTGSPYIVTNSHHTGSRAIWWQVPNYNNAQYPTYQMLVLPGVDNTIDLRELRLTFWAGEFFNHNANSIFYVGVMTNPNNVNTFTQVASVPLVPIGSSGMDWNEYHVDLNTYTGSGRYVALRAVRTGSYWGAAMDDITLDYIPPTAIDTVAVACDSFSWRNTTYYASGIYTRPRTEHNFTVYDTLHLTINHGTHNVEYDTADLSYTWHSTTYISSGTYTYNYTNTDGCASTDTLHLEIHDPYAPVLVDETHPFFDDFEGNVPWQMWNGTQTNKWIIGMATSNGGNNALYVSNDNGLNNQYTVSNAQSVVFATKLFTLTPGHHYFSYDWKANGESSYDYLRVFLAPESATLTPGTVPSGITATGGSGTPTGWIALDGNTKKNLSSIWGNYVAETTITSGGNYRMVLMWRNDNGGGNQPPAAVDNVNIIKSNCIRPTNVAASSITATGATLTWSGSATSYQVAYGGGATPTEMTPQTVSGTTLQLSSLSPSTTYRVYVRALCSASDQSPWSEVYTFTTLCGELTSLPYTQGFEESTTGQTSSFNVECWYRYSSSGNNPYVYTSTAAHSGNNILYWNGSSYYTRLVVLPGVSNQFPVSTLRLKFWMRASAASYHPYVTVGVMMDPTVVNSFVPVETVDVEGTTWREFTVNLNSYTGGGRYIALRALAPNAAWYAYLDDFTIEVIPPCPEPTGLAATQVTHNSATLTWTGVSATSYTVAYGMGANTNSMDTLRVNTPTATLTGLTPNATYNVYVRANCTGGHGDWGTPCSFHTPCAPLATLPYVEDFSTASTGTSAPFDVPCWQRLSSSYYPYVYSNTTYGTYLYWYQAANSTSYSYVVLPAVDTTLHPMNTLRLSFQGRSTSTSYHPAFEVGVMGDPTDTGTFTRVATINIEGNTYTEYYANLTTYTGNGRHIALRSVNTGSLWYAYLDDVTISLAPPCPEPIEIAATGITATSATIAWQGTAPGYLVAYGTGTTPTGMPTQNTTGSTITLSNLSPNTEYHVFVRSMCNGGLQSDWSPMCTFRTECMAITYLPYTEGFEGLNTSGLNAPAFTVNCWKRYTNGTVYYIPYVGSQAHTGTRGLVWSLINTVYYGSSQYVVLPEMAVPGQPVNTLQLTFWAKNSTATAQATFQVGVMTDPNDTSTFTLVATKNVTDTEWVTDTTRLETYTGNGTYIALRSRNNGNSGNAYLDDFTVEVAPLCLTPTALAASNVTPNTATLGWSGTATSYQVAYGTGSDIASLTTINVTGTSTTLTGLTHNTDYHVYVRAVCPFGNSPWTAMYTFHTPCTVYPPVVTTERVCESYTWHGTAYTATGLYTFDTLIEGCPRTDTLHLTVDHSTAEILTVTACESYTWHGTAYTATGLYTFDTMIGVCSRTDTLSLTINHGTHNSVTETVPESYTWHGTTYTTTGVYTYNYTNDDGCPSTDTLHLTVDPYAPVLVNETHPFYDGFEGNVLCWQLFNGNLTNKWYRGTAAHSTGDKAIYISNDNGSSNAYTTSNATSAVFATKKFILPAGHFYFSYDWRCNAEADYDYMRVYLAPANTTFTAGTLPTGVSITGTPSGWRVLDRGSQMNQTTSWGNYTAEVNITDSAIYQVVFLWYNDSYVGSQPPAAIDEVRFVKSDCLRPTNVSLQSVGTTTATLSWTGTATTYQVAYGTTPTLADMDTLTVTGNTATLTGLAHTTTHYAYVRSLCNDEQSAWSTVLSFRTACGPIALPYSYGFEDATASGSNGAINECWHKGSSTPNSYNYPYPYSYYSHDGYYAMYMVAEASYYSYIVLPQFDNPVNRTQLTFWGRAAGSSYASTVEIGVVTNPSDITTFQRYETFTIPNTGVLQWHCDTVMFDTYQGNGQYIAIRLQGGGNARCYLDDFTVEAMPECSGVRNIAVTATTDSTISLSWHETGAATSWGIEYGPQGFPQGSGTTVTVTDTTATLTGLTNDTWYDIYIHSDCVHATSRAQRISAQTDCGRMAIPFYEDFSGYASSDSPIDRCWYKCYSQNNSQTSYPQFTYNSSDNSDYFLYFLSTRNYYSYLVLPSMQGNIHDQMLRFKVKTSGGTSANIQVGVVTTATNFNTFQQVQQLSVSSNSEWVTLNVPFNSLSGANYRIAIVSPRMNYSGNTSQGFYVDDVEVVPIPDCNAPTSLAASNITTTGATLHWNAATGISHYRVVYTPYGDYDSSYRVTVDSIASTSLPLTGLQMGTTYDVEVYSLCITGSLSTAATTTFSTSCSAHSVPFTENFDHGSGTHVSPCWNNGFYGSATSTYPTVSAANPKYEGDKALLFFSSSNNMYSYAILPELDDTLSLLQFKLQARTGNGTNTNVSLQIGTVAASANITTFQTVQNVQLNDSWQYYTVPLTSVTDNSRRLAIRYQPNGGQGQAGNVLVDDIIVERIPACDGPTRVWADRILYNQARINWPAVAGVTSYSLEYGPSGFTLGQGTQVTGLTDTTYILSGLNASTTYSVYLTATCASGRESSLVSVSFATGCLEQLPYEYGFEGLTTSPTGTVTTVPCWVLNENTSVQSGQYTTGYAAEGISRMRFSVSQATAYAVMPKLDDSINHLYMTLQVNTGTTYFDEPLAPLYVGVVTDPYDFSTFLPVDTLLPTASNTWQSFRVDFNSLTDNDYYIAFYGTGSYYTSYVYLDDIHVYLIAPHNINLTLTDASRGTVAVNGVTTNHAQALAGSDVTLTATANHGYTFSHWAAGITANPYTFVMPDHDVAYNHIVFSLNTYTVTVLSNDTTLGTVTGGGSYDYLDTATLTATPIGNYNFLRWSDGVTTNPRTLIVTDDTTLTALFQNDCPVGTDTTIVACDSYTWNDTPYTATGVYTHDRSTAQCTVVDTLHLTVNHSTHNVVYDTAELSYTWHDSVYTATGVYTYNYTNTDGCASSDTLHLVIDPTLPVLVDEEHPFFDDFEEGLRWTFTNNPSPYTNNPSNNAWCYGTAAPHTGSHSVYISNDNGVSNNYSWTLDDNNNYCPAAYTTKRFILRQGAYSFSYNWRSNGSFNNDYLRVFLVPDAEVLPSNGQIPTSWIALDGNTALSGQTVWNYHAAQINVTNPGIYKMVFFWRNTVQLFGEGHNPPAAVDNVSIVKTTCTPPTNLQNSNTTTTATTLAWTGTGTRFTVAYGIASSPLDMDTLSVTGNSVRITNLSPSSYYHVFVRKWCDASQASAWSEMFTFNTGCGPITELPITESFESCGVLSNPGSIPFNLNCWNILSNNSTTAPDITIRTEAGYAHSGNNIMEFPIQSTSNYYIVLPQIDTHYHALNNLYLSFWAFPNGRNINTPAKLAVGVMDSPTDTGSFTPVDTLELFVNVVNNIYRPGEFGINLRPYQGSGSCIALRPVYYNENKSILLDDIIVDYMPANADTTVVACGSYTWGDSTYTTSGIYSRMHLFHAIPVYDTLRLTILPATSGSETLTACDSYTWHGTTYTASGTYTFDTLNANGCDSTATLHLTVNHSTTNSESLVVCDNYTWHGTRYTASGDYTYNYTNAEGCASTDTLHLTVNHSTSRDTTAVACDSFTWRDSIYTISTRATSITTNAVGCDSTVTLHLTVNRSTHDSFRQTACDSYTWHGTPYTTSGVYTNDYTNAAGCASTDTLHLTVNYSNTGIDTQTACESYRWINGVTYYESTNTPTVTLTNAAGCDSVVTLNLTVNYHSIWVWHRTVCDSIVWHGNTYTFGGTYYYDTLNAEGCDSLTTLVLTVNHSTHDNYYQNSCGNYTWNGTTYTTSGTFTYDYTNTVGCASTDTLHLVIDQHTDTAFYVTACDGYRWNDSLYTQSGVYTYNYSTAGSTCTNVDTLYLTVNYSTSDTLDVTTCDSYTWHDSTYLYPYPDGITYPYTSTYTFATTSAAGCDSVETLHLTIKRSVTGADIVTACDRYTWINGITYTTSNYNTSNYTLTATNGCDSVVTLYLTLNHSTTGDTVATACDSFTWRGTNYTSTTSATSTTTNAAGCDSVVTLHLTVNYSTAGDTVATACDSFDWRDSIYTSSTSATSTTTNAAGCDSVVTLHLTVNYSTTGDTVATACERFTWRDSSYTSSTSATSITSNIAGCDSTVTLHLTIYEAAASDIYDTACESYIWADSPNSQIYTESGDYTLTGQTIHGCDSVVNLHLTINHGTHDDYYQHACDTFVWHGTVYTATGTYLYEYQNADGCASVDTLHLTVDQHSDTAYHVSACDAYRWNDSLYTESGIYIYDYSLAGSSCTNVDTLYLTVNHSADSDLYVTACDSYNWLGTVIPEGDWYTESGTYVRHMQTVGGCDSTATLHLTLNHRSELDTTLVACDTLFWTVEDTTFVITESGDYFVVGALVWTVIDDSYLELGRAFLNAEGCDSTQTLHVTIGHSTTGDTAATACDHFDWYGTSYTSSTSATRTTSNAAGCDSVVTLHLTINYSTAGDTVATACDSFEWRDSSYTSSTSATSTTTNAAGCDSVVTLHLTVNYGIYTSTYTAACDTFAWHDSVYTSSGTYLFLDETAEGCPMVDTLVLTLSNGTSTGYHVETCDGYIWNGTLYTETGNYIYDYSQLGGDCQNVDTLFLLIHHSTYTEVFDTACDSYTWFGTDYTSSTNERMITRDIFGCDSTVTLHLTLHYNTSTAYTDTLGEDGTYTWHGHTYSDTGTYLYDYITDEGCASTDTLYLSSNYIAPVYYTLHARSADTVMGYVVVYPDSVARSGDTVIVVGVPHEGYRFTHWSDGDTNGARLVRLTSDTTLVAYFDVYVGIDEAETPTFRIWAETGNIQVEGTGIAGMPVRAYDLTGRMLYNQRAEGNRVTISTSRWATGVYLVRVGNLPAQRIVLR